MNAFIRTTTVPGLSLAPGIFYQIRFSRLGSCLRYKFYAVNPEDYIIHGECRCIPYFDTQDSTLTLSLNSRNDRGSLVVDRIAFDAAQAFKFTDLCEKNLALFMLDDVPRIEFYKNEFFKVGSVPFRYENG